MAPPKFDLIIWNFSKIWGNEWDTVNLNRSTTLFIRNLIRTNNALERHNKELKRKTGIRPIFDVFIQNLWEVSKSTQERESHTKKIYLNKESFEI